MNRDDKESAVLLHTIGYLYLSDGQYSRAAVFLLIANRIDPDHRGILRTLAASLIEGGAGERALGVIERLSANDDHVSAQYLRARALWLLDRKADARRCFRDHLHLRTAL